MTPPASRGERRPRVLIAGGGTVGHLAPGFAVAERLRELGTEVHFATPGEDRERDWFSEDERGARHRSPADRFPRRPWAWPVFGVRLLGNVRRARRLLRHVAPGAVLALGGWPCVPAALAARLAKIPLCLLASDAAPGLAVRRLAPLATRIYLARASARAALGESEGILVTGPALRRQILEGKADHARFGLDPGRRTLFVTGGSLGARALNEAMVLGITRAAAADPDLAKRLQVIHSVGESGDGVAAAYAAAGVLHHVTPFVSDMGTAYRTADLVVSRAGALTCGELAVAGTPAVLVPYPHHEDRQQYRNAETLVEAGGAILVEERDLDPPGVAHVVIALLDATGRLSEMAAGLRGAFGDGARQIAADLVRLL